MEGDKEKAILALDYDDDDSSEEEEDEELFDNSKVDWRVKGILLRGKDFTVSENGNCPRCQSNVIVFVILDELFPMGDMPEILYNLLAKGKAVLWSSQDKHSCKKAPTFMCRGFCPPDPLGAGFNINWDTVNLTKLLKDLLKLNIAKAQKKLQENEKANENEGEDDVDEKDIIKTMLAQEQEKKEKPVLGPLKENETPKEEASSETVVTTSTTAAESSTIPVTTSATASSATTAATYPVSKDGSCPHCGSTVVRYIILIKDSTKDITLPPTLEKLLTMGKAFKMAKGANSPPSFQCCTCTYGFNLDWSKTDLKKIFNLETKTTSSPASTTTATKTTSTAKTTTKATTSSTTVSSTSYKSYTSTSYPATSYQASSYGSYAYTQPPMGYGAPGPYGYPGPAPLMAHPPPPMGGMATPPYGAPIPYAGAQPYLGMPPQPYAPPPGAFMGPPQPYPGAPPNQFGPIPPGNIPPPVSTFQLPPRGAPMYGMHANMPGNFPGTMAGNIPVGMSVNVSSPGMMPMPGPIPGLMQVPGGPMPMPGPMQGPVPVPGLGPFPGNLQGPGNMPGPVNMQGMPRLRVPKGPQKGWNKNWKGKWKGQEYSGNPENLATQEQWPHVDGDEGNDGEEGTSEDLYDPDAASRFEELLNKIDDHENDDADNEDEKPPGEETQAEFEVTAFTPDEKPAVENIVKNEPESVVEKTQATSLEKVVKKEPESSVEKTQAKSLESIVKKEPESVVEKTQAKSLENVVKKEPASIVEKAQVNIESSVTVESEPMEQDFTVNNTSSTEVAIKPEPTWDSGLANLSENNGEANVTSQGESGELETSPTPRTKASRGRKRQATGARKKAAARNTRIKKAVGDSAGSEDGIGNNNDADGLEETGNEIKKVKVEGEQESSGVDESLEGETEEDIAPKRVTRARSLRQKK